MQVTKQVRTGHGKTDWFQIGKGVHQGCILSPCLFNLYAEYIVRNAGLDEAQAGIKIAGRNINNLRYADDTFFLAQGKEELKSLLMKVREIQKNIYFCFADYAKAFDCVDHKKLENSSRDGNTRSPDLTPEKSVCRSRRKLELDMEKQTGSK